MSNNFCWGKINSYFFVKKPMITYFYPQFLSPFFLVGRNCEHVHLPSTWKKSIKEAESEKKTRYHPLKSRNPLPWNSRPFAPENGWFEDDRVLPFGILLFSGTFAVSFREGISQIRPRHYWLCPVLRWVPFPGSKDFPNKPPDFRKDFGGFLSKLRICFFRRKKNPDRRFVGFFQRQKKQAETW